MPPVGGITIYEAFDLALHPMRLQIDTRVGKKIMEYVWPARRNRPDASPTTPDTYRLGPPSPTSCSPRRASLDIPSPTRKSIDTGRLVASPLRRLGTSRSFTDLRNSRQDTLQISPRLHRTKSTDALYVLDGSGSPGVPNSKTSDENKSSLPKESDDAAEMKTRSSQKTFVWVRVARFVSERKPMYGTDRSLLQSSPNAQYHEGKLFPLSRCSDQNPSSGIPKSNLERAYTMSELKNSLTHQTNSSKSWSISSSRRVATGKDGLRWLSTNPLSPCCPLPVNS